MCKKPERALPIVATALVIMALLVACVPAPLSPTPEPKGGGEFRVILLAEPQSLNPDLHNDDASVTVANNLLNRLVTLDADYRVIPDLVETWQVSTDGLTYTFQLAKNAHWRKGKPDQARTA